MKAYEFSKYSICIINISNLDINIIINNNLFNNKRRWYYYIIKKINKKINKNRKKYFLR